MRSLQYRITLILVGSIVAVMLVRFQQRVFMPQFGDPVIELALTLARRQPLPLPHAVIQVLHGQRRQRW